MSDVEADLPSDPRLRALIEEVAAAPREPAFPGESIGPYVITGRLGRGGMGVVYRARDVRLDREVALKVLPHRGALDEARLLARVQHPRVPAVFDVGEDGGRFYLAMELVMGGSLRARLERGIDRALAVRWLFDLAEGLAHLHGLGIVHRDLKPENVVIGDDGRARLVDFGISSSASLLGGDSPAAGTKGYAAPEQLAGGPSDPRSDVYAFGILAKELLGEKPWRDVVRDCTRESPGDRPKDAAMVLQRIRRLERTRPIRRVAALLSGLAIMGAAAAYARSGPSGARVYPATRQSFDAPVIDAALSPDGRELVYADPAGVFVKTLATGMVRPLSGAPKLDGSVGCVSWAPDGESVYASDANGVVRVSTSEARSSRAASAGCARPSPDGRFVAIRDDQNGTLTLLEAATGNSTVLRPAGESAVFGAISWSPRASRLAAIEVAPSKEGKRVELRAYDLATERWRTIRVERRLLGSAGLSGQVWIDEDRIAVVLHASDGRPNVELRLWPIDAGLEDEGERIAEIPGVVAGNLTASSDGRRLVLFGLENQADVVQADLRVAPFALAKLTASSSNELPAAFSEDGSQLWLMTDLPKGRAVVARDLASGRIEALPGAEDSSWMTYPVPADAEGGLVHWAIRARGPDAGEAVLIHRRAGVARELFTTNTSLAVAGGQRPPPHDHSVRCAPDRRRCFLLSRDGYRIAIRAIDLDSGLLELTGEIETGYAADFGFALSADATLLAIGDAKRGAVRVFGADGKDVAAVVLPGCAPQYVAWEGRAKALIATSICEDGAGAYQLHRVRPFEGTSEKLVASATGWMLAPVVSRDGARLAVAAMAIGGNAWVIER